LATQISPAILFVDDEESIRITFPPILESYGFTVVSAATTAEALRLITQRPFEVLIADLNIDRPGDGLTVVSAMRSTHPDALAFILTGYPAFETALEAIRQQVDDYFVKPSDPEEIVSRIRSKLSNRSPVKRIQARRLADVIEQNHNVVVESWLVGVKQDEQISAINISDSERKDHFVRFLGEAISIIRGRKITAGEREAARLHGESWARQGYTLPLILREAKILRKALGDFIQQHLLEIVVSRIVSDMSRMYETFDDLLEEAAESFLQQVSHRNKTKKP